MEQEEQQNHQGEKHQAGDHEHLERDHEPQQIADKDADTQTCMVSEEMRHRGGKSKVEIPAKI